MSIFVSKLGGDGMSVKLYERQSSVTLPYNLLVVFEKFVGDTSACRLFLVRDSWVLNASCVYI